MSKLLRAWTWIPWYCSILFTWIKVWGLNERVKKRRITFNHWDWDNSLRPSVNLPGALGLAINMWPNYPHLTSLDYVETLSLWWINPCSECASTRYDSTPRRWYGTPIEARVYLDHFARGGRMDRRPSFSLLSYFSIYYILILCLH